jgi:ligand-binding sensor domain-containing protein
MWFGTDNGMSKFMDGNWRTIGRQNGLLESHVYALAVAPGDEIWAGTKRGVARIGKK